MASLFAARASSASSSSAGKRAPARARTMCTFHSDILKCPEKLDMSLRQCWQFWPVQQVFDQMPLQCCNNCKGARHLKQTPEKWYYTTKPYTE